MSADLNSIDVFPWNSNFETGIEVIDEQHRNLVSLLNRLAVTLADSDQHAIQSVFEELASYANYHFATEEKVWGEVFDSDDPWLDAHKHNHDSFIPQVLAIREHDRGGSIEASVEEIVRFLIHWLACHIVDDDRRMALAILEYNEGATLDQAKIRADEKMAGSVDILVDTLLSMYDSLSSRTLDLMRERAQREKVEAQLRKVNQELEKLSITDPLTGLYNRRHFDELLGYELRRCSRSKEAIGLMLLDIDYFKKLNDHYGHLVGDDALKSVAECLRRMCRRPGDFCFRIGGEEFCVIVEDATGDAARGFAERIREAVQALEIPNEPSTVAAEVTVSIGLVCAVPEVGDTVESFLARADECLYQAKDCGRNQVVCRI